MRTRIVVVDDHPVFRYGLVSLIESEASYQVVAQAGEVKEALALLDVQTPDLLLVDLSLGGEQTGLDLLEIVRERHPQVLTLVVSIHNEAVYAEKARLAGARGYITKQSSSATLKAALRTVLSGSTAFPRPGDATCSRGTPESLGTLSPREQDVLELLGKGRGVSEIAGMLGLSVKTIGVHQDHLKAKLGVTTNYELRRHAIEWVSSR